MEEKLERKTLYFYTGGTHFHKIYDDYAKDMLPHRTDWFHMPSFVISLVVCSQWRLDYWQLIYSIVWIACGSSYGVGVAIGKGL